MVMLCHLSGALRANSIAGQVWIHGIGRLKYPSTRDDPDPSSFSWGCALPNGDVDKTVSCFVDFTSV